MIVYKDSLKNVMSKNGLKNVRYTGKEVSGLFSSQNVVGAMGGALAARSDTAYVFRSQGKSYAAYRKEYLFVVELKGQRL